MDMNWEATYWNNKEDVLAMVKCDVNWFADASAELRDDRETVLSAVRIDGYALKYASDRFHCGQLLVSLFLLCARGASKR